MKYSVYIEWSDGKFASSSPAKDIHDVVRVLTNEIAAWHEGTEQKLSEYPEGVYMSHIEITPEEE